MKTFFFESIYNTQEYALSELSSEPILVISYSQEKGKGTSNRTWLNADQALACSLAVKQEDIKLNHTLIPLLSGYVFIEVLKDINLSLKWPNDIILKNLKVGGILVEKSENNICIGMGINYFWDKPEVPGAGSIFTKKQKDSLINSHAEQWASKTLSSLSKNNFDLDKYKQKLQTLGKIVEYPEGRGWAEDINEDGSLKIKSTDGDYINLTSPLIYEVN
ncbi:MAG: biotin--[acetyl-CoA-carboxylase] ligase [Candidatus Actinomarina sp.]|nr:biotin--[acetyl-CoA-carboxylase] ligase [Candidatus Actinomarina sp.]MBL6836174.1 biotin--[acetyl-CoA-carboxylase] ligase [Candidatus Actinomarina sp.]